MVVPGGLNPNPVLAAAVPSCPKVGAVDVAVLGAPKENPVAAGAAAVAGAAPKDGDAPKDRDAAGVELE